MVVIFFEQSGVGDMIIYTNYLTELANKYGPVTLLVKKSSRADQLFKYDKNVKKIIFLDRGKNGENHEGIKGAFKLAKEIKNSGNYEAAFLFSSSLRYHLIFKMLAGIKEVYQFPMFQKNDDIILSAKLLTEKCLNKVISTESRIKIPTNLIEKAKNKYNIDSNFKNIVIGGGGSGKTKIWPSKNFLGLCEKLQKQYPCRFFLAGGPKDSFIDDFLNSPLKESCLSFKDLSIGETMPIIANADIAICNDSAFMHIVAALNKKVIGLFGDTPIVYSSWSENINIVEAPGLEGKTKHDSLSTHLIRLEDVHSKVLELLK